jgi:hypothetical protein
MKMGLDHGFQIPLDHSLRDSVTHCGYSELSHTAVLLRNLHPLDGRRKVGP